MHSAGDTPVQLALRELAAGRGLTEQGTADAFGQVMRGEAPAGQVAALLMALRVRGESAAEVTGAVRALRAAMVTVPVTGRRHLIDTCGTGGGVVGTFNISTAAALVAVGAGARVAKHGNRSYTSRCGSADVLEALGVDISLDASGAADTIDRAGMAFLFAPAFHPAMRFVGPVRRELGVPTLMNIVGPLANPAGVSRQLVGVADASVAPLVADVLARLGADHALVVHGDLGMDEIAPVGTTTVWEIRAGVVTRTTLDPTQYGLWHEPITALAGGDPGENATRIEALLQDPEADPGGSAAVVLNAGAACYVAGLAPSLAEGFAVAREALQSGRAAAALERLRQTAPASTSG